MNTINPIAQAAQEISGYQQAMRQTGSGTASVQATQLARWRAALEQAIQPQAEAAPDVTDAMALAFHRALTDGAIGQSEVEDIKTGLRAAIAQQKGPQP